MLYQSDTFEVDSVFLKKPSRIEALMMVMTLCLMIYAIAQNTLRKAIEQSPEPLEIKYAPKKQSLTMTRVFKLFRSVQCLTISINNEIQVLITNLTPTLKKIIGFFGSNAELMYASSA